MSFCGLSVALSLVFGGCLVLAVVAQLYYFLWWKKRKHLDIEMGVGNYAKRLSFWGCWTKPCSMHDASTNPVDLWPQIVVARDTETPGREPDLELGVGGNDLVAKPCGEESVEVELMRLHNLAGPPRFLYTITEETEEDLESEDISIKGSRTRSLSDFDSPFLTPMASSPLKCSLDNIDSYNKHQGFNPLFESSAESEFNRFRSSPPPKLKFLREAEDKLYRKLIEEGRRKAMQNSSQVLPLASSPTTFRTELH
ncbi:uncharacterized protein LOC130743381 [Lotus japonicus]|uniref:uncharacterized protein LOC130743381 n=1 Tax=Lotus japonicus TaxID=34305 RepID=UPI00258F9E8E|nr:uncharacterized protein LOC130743381 [Lotus japonicus]